MNSYRIPHPTILSLYKIVVLYHTFGNEPLKEPVNVTTDSTVVLPSATRAGTEF